LCDVISVVTEFVVRIQRSVSWTVLYEKGVAVYEKGVAVYGVR
jgi:hypothetical protein